MSFISLSLTIGITVVPPWFLLGVAPVSLPVAVVLVAVVLRLVAEFLRVPELAEQIVQLLVLARVQVLVPALLLRLRLLELALLPVLLRQVSFPRLALQGLR